MRDRFRMGAGPVGRRELGHHPLVRRGVDPVKRPGRIGVAASSVRAAEVLKIGVQRAGDSLGSDRSQSLSRRLEERKHSFVEDVGLLDVAQVRSFGDDEKLARGDRGVELLLEPWWRGYVESTRDNQHRDLNR